MMPPLWSVLALVGLNTLGAVLGPIAYAMDTPIFGVKGFGVVWAYFGGFNLAVALMGWGALLKRLGYLTEKPEEATA